jgi:hypothetical protein
MKTLRFFGVALLTVLLSVSFSACSSSSDDDVDNGSGSSPATTNKFLIKQKMTNNDGEVQLEWTYSYDSNNRLSKISAVSHVGNMSADSYSYSYGNNSIEVNGITYNVSNGRIISTNNGVSFTYDNDGYLTSASKNGNTITYIWSGGNIVNISYKRSSDAEEIESVSYEYTNLSYPQNFPYSPETTDRSHADGFKGLTSLIGGYWGKTPKNLPKKYVYKYKGEVDETDDYEFTMQDGYPSIIKSTDERGHVSINTLEWK